MKKITLTVVIALLSLNAFSTAFASEGEKWYSNKYDVTKYYMDNGDDYCEIEYSNTSDGLLSLLAKHSLSKKESIEQRVFLICLNIETPVLGSASVKIIRHSGNHTERIPINDNALFQIKCCHVLKDKIADDLPEISRILLTKYCE